MYTQIDKQIDRYRYFVKLYIYCVRFMSRVYFYIKQYRDIASYSSLAPDSQDYSTLSPCTLYTVHSTHTIQYIVHSKGILLHIPLQLLTLRTILLFLLIHCTQYTVHCTQNRDIASYFALAPDSQDYSTLSLCTLYTVRTLYSTWILLHIPHQLLTLRTSLYTLSTCTLYIVHSTHYTVHSTQYAPLSDLF